MPSRGAPASGVANDRMTRMHRFMILTFLLLGWGFFEASGGSEFAQPAAASLAPPVIVGSIEEAHEGAMAGITWPAARAAYAAAAPAESMPVEIVTRARMDFGAPLGPVLATLPSEAAPARAEVPLDLRRVAGSRVNMRAGPGTGHEVVSVLSRGARAEVLEEQGGWTRVRAEDGAAGWMATSLLSAI